IHKSAFAMVALFTVSFRRKCLADCLLDRNAQLPEPGRLVPIAALEFDLAVDDVKEPAPAQGERFAIAGPARELAPPGSASRPFENGPIALFKQVLDVRLAIRERAEE